jgi:hypothetical protein
LCSLHSAHANLTITIELCTLFCTSQRASIRRIDAGDDINANVHLCYLHSTYTNFTINMQLYTLQRASIRRIDAGGDVNADALAAVVRSCVDEYVRAVARVTPVIGADALPPPKPEFVSIGVDDKFVVSRLAGLPRSAFVAKAAPPPPRSALTGAAVAGSGNPGGSNPGDGNPGGSSSVTGAAVAGGMSTSSVSNGIINEQRHQAGGTSTSSVTNGSGTGTPVRPRSIGDANTAVDADVESKATSGGADGGDGGEFTLSVSTAMGAGAAELSDAQRKATFTPLKAPPPPSPRAPADDPLLKHATAITAITATSIAATTATGGGDATNGVNGIGGNTDALLNFAAIGVSIGGFSDSRGNNGGGGGGGGGIGDVGVGGFSRGGAYVNNSGNNGSNGFIGAGGTMSDVPEASGAETSSTSLPSRVLPTSASLPSRVLFASRDVNVSTSAAAAGAGGLASPPPSAPPSASQPRARRLSLTLPPPSALAAFSTSTCIINNTSSSSSAAASGEAISGVHSGSPRSAAMLDEGARRAAEWAEMDANSNVV